jgi:hypothetical protein
MAENRMHRGRESGVNGLVLGAALAVLVAWPVRAECITAPVWRERVAAASPTLIIADPETAGPKLATLVVDAYNDKAPQSQLAPDTVVMLLARDRATGLPLGQAMFGLFTGGCIAGTYLVPLPAARIIGEPV